MKLSPEFKIFIAYATILLAMILTSINCFSQTSTPQSILAEGKEIMLDCHYIGVGVWDYDTISGDSAYVVIEQGFFKSTFVLQHDCIYYQWEDGKVNKMWWVPSVKYDNCDCWLLESNNRFCFNYANNRVIWYTNMRKGDGRYLDAIINNKMDIKIRTRD